MFLISLLTLSSAMLPGTKLIDYIEGADLKIFVNKLDSSKTLVPFEYNFLKFCNTKQNDLGENLGQELSGDSLRESEYVLKMNKNTTCNKLCERYLTKYDIINFKNMIDSEYKASWVLDSLPAGEIKINAEEKCKKYNYNDGFPVGFKENNTYYVFNHHNIEVLIHNEGNNNFTVVGFLVEPLNLNRLVQNDSVSCKEMSRFNLTYSDKCNTSLSGNEFLGTSIHFTYSIRFIEKKTKWNERWSSYLTPSGSSSPDLSHYFSLIQSTIMVFILASMIATVLRRSVLRDIDFYNDSFDEEFETGWKQVRSDVFRSPKYSSLFCITIGTGTQLLTTIYITIIFALCNLLSPKYQGALLSGVIICYALMGIFAGYTSARFFKMFGGTAWQKNAIGTATFLPGLCMTVFLFINLVLSADGSSGAVSFLNLLYLLFMWLIASLSLVYIGAFIGSSKNVIENTCRVSKIPKPIQVTPGLNKLRLVGFLAGVLPFASVVIEMNDIMAALWHPERFYYFFGFLFICSIILVITSAEAAILLVYLLLSREDYRWWWLSFFVPGSSGVYMFFYAIWYCFSRLALTGFSAYALYFGYMFLICVGFMIATGTFGFYASYFFIRIIYSMIKQD